jgi:[ribosomal protein S5]-alanine N-acetyltransferase
MNETQIVPLIRADNIDLRPTTEADIDGLFEMLSNPEVMKYWGRPCLKDRSEAKEYFESIQTHVADRSAMQWAIVRRSDKQFMGTCTLWHFDWNNQRCEVGYGLARRFWGQGFMQQAIRAMIQYAFQTLNLHRIEADVDPENAKSLRLLEGIGFQREGYLRERWLVEGRVMDAIYLGLLKSDWQKRQKDYADR